MITDLINNSHSSSVSLLDSARDGAVAFNARPGDRQDVAASRQHRLHEPILSSLSSTASIPILESTSIDSFIAPRSSAKLDITTQPSVGQMLSMAFQQNVVNLAALSILKKTVKTYARQNGITLRADITRLRSTDTQQGVPSEVENGEPAKAVIEQFSSPDEGSIHQLTEAEASAKAKLNLEGGNTRPPAPTSPDSLNASDPAADMSASARQQKEAVVIEGSKLRSTENPAPGTDNPTESGLIEHRHQLSPVLAELITRAKALQTLPSQPNNAPNFEQPSPNPRPGAGETAVKAPDPNDWVAQSAAMQRSLAELGQKAALDTALLKLQNDLNDATVSVMKSIGSSVKSAAQ